MGLINLDDIKPGMILARDITNKNGLVLLRAGSEITEKHIRILRIWGITEADIKGVDKEEIMQKVTANIDPSILREAEKRVQEIFRHTNQEHPFNKELIRQVEARLIRRLS